MNIKQTLIIINNKSNNNITEWKFIIDTMGVLVFLICGNDGSEETNLS